MPQQHHAWLVLMSSAHPSFEENILEWYPATSSLCVAFSQGQKERNYQYCYI